MSLVMVRWLVLTQLLENFQIGNDTNINRQKELLKRPSGINGSVLNILEMWPIPCNAYMIYLVRICAYLFCLLCNSHPTSISAYVMWGAKDRIQVRIKFLSCTKKKLKFSLLKNLTLCHILQTLTYWIAFFFFMPSYNY